jgi:hypothetical protein
MAFSEEEKLKRKRESRNRSYVTRREMELAKGKEYYLINKEKVAARHKRYRNKNKKHISERNIKYNKEHSYQQKQYRMAHRKTSRDYNLKKCYGITLDDYNIMFEEQNGCCAVCGIHQSIFKKTLFVDHDHVSGKIRGLLCHDCNIAIGNLKDDPKLFYRAIDYLLKNK